MTSRKSSFLGLMALATFCVHSASAGDLTFIENDAVGTSPVAITTGDFDNDGFLDLAVVNSFSGTVSLLKNKGNGKFKTADSYPVGVSPHAIVAGHFHSNACLDLAVANAGSNTISILPNKCNGSGKFNAKNDIPGGPAN